MQNKFQYTFGGKFSVFGYSDPNTDINQSELASESRYFIKNINSFPTLLFKAGNKNMTF